MKLQVSQAVEIEVHGFVGSAVEDALRNCCIVDHGGGVVPDQALEVIDDLANVWGELTMVSRALRPWADADRWELKA